MDKPTLFDRASTMFLWVLAAIGAVSLLLVVFGGTPAYGASTLYLKVDVLCLTKEIVLDVVETPNPERQTIYRQYLHNGSCHSFAPNLAPVRVVEIVTETMWAGGGPAVVVVELRAQSGVLLYAWFTRKTWDNFMDPTLGI